MATIETYRIINFPPLLATVFMVITHSCQDVKLVFEVVAPSQVE